MRQYNILKALGLAFYSKPLYKDVAQNWRGTGLLYVLLLALICSITFTHNVYHIVDRLVEAFKPLVAQAPTITIRSGQVSIDQAEPYYIRVPDNDEIFAIIDTTGKTASLEGTTGRVLLTKDRLIIQEGIKLQNFDLTTAKDATYTAEILQDFLVKLSYIITAIAFPFGLALYFILGAIAIFCYAALAKLFIYTDISYKATCRLAAIALTPSYLLAALLSVLSFNLPYRWVIFVPLSIGYLIYAIKSNWEPEAESK